MGSHFNQCSHSSPQHGIAQSGQNRSRQEVQNWMQLSCGEHLSQTVFAVHTACTCIEAATTKWLAANNALWLTDRLLFRPDIQMNKARTRKSDTSHMSNNVVYLTVCISAPVAALDFYRATTHATIVMTACGAATGWHSVTSGHNLPYLYL